MAVRTKQQLIDLYPDNNEGLITPERLRDFVDSMENYYAHLFTWFSFSDNVTQSRQVFPWAVEEPVFSNGFTHHPDPEFEGNDEIEYTGSMARLFQFHGQIELFIGDTDWEGEGFHVNLGRDDGSGVEWFDNDMLSGATNMRIPDPITPDPTQQGFVRNLPIHGLIELEPGDKIVLSVSKFPSGTRELELYYSIVFQSLFT